MLRANFLDFDSTIRIIIVRLPEDRWLIQILAVLVPVIEELNVLSKLLFAVRHLVLPRYEDLKPERIVLVFAYGESETLSVLLLKALEVGFKRLTQDLLELLEYLFAWPELAVVYSQGEH